MNDNDVKIKLRIGQFEVEYEGHNSFLKENIFHLMERAIEIHAKHGQTIPTHSLQDNSTGDDNDDDDGVKPVGHSRKWELAVSTIATRLSAKSGPDLASAAAAHLTLVQGRERFSRQDLLENMKAHSGMYKTSIGKNLTSTIQSLIRNGRLNEVAQGSYSLTAAEKERVESSLANST